MTFKKYLESIKDKDSPQGDFAQDALRDKTFPWEKANDPNSGCLSVSDYLRVRSACWEAKEAFRAIWRNYKKRRPEDCS